MSTIRRIARRLFGSSPLRDGKPPALAQTGRERRETRISDAVYPSLNGKTVMVTGGASGIGEAIVRSFADQGSRVGFLDIDTDRGKALEEELRDKGETAEFFHCDLKDIYALKEAAARVSAALGPPAVLVNNAANDDRHDWTGVTEPYFDERIAINVRHLFFAIQAVAPGMIAAGHGSIINLGSNSWMQGVGGMPIYATAKAAVHGLTRSFARDLGPHRIRVNTVVPGWVMTERQRKLWVTPEALRYHLQRQCLPDAVQPVHIARMVLFLASDDSIMCTANNYMVEAGVI